jgi:hypothetical protein
VEPAPVAAGRSFRLLTLVKCRPQRRRLRTHGRGSLAVNVPVRVVDAGLWGDQLMNNPPRKESSAQ